MPAASAIIKLYSIEIVFKPQIQKIRKIRTHGNLERLRVRRSHDQNVDVADVKPPFYVIRVVVTVGIHPPDAMTFEAPQSGSPPVFFGTLRCFVGDRPVDPLPAVIIKITDEAK